MRFSQASKDREELFPVNADMEAVDAEEVERMGKPWRRLTSASFVVLRLLLPGCTPASAITSLGTTSGIMSGPTTLMKVIGLLEAPHPSRQKLRRFLSPWKPPFSLSLC